MAEFRQRFLMVTTKDLMRASVVGEELIEEGFERGIERGRKENIQRTRKHVRGLLTSRFPGETDTGWLDTIDDIGQLDRLFDALLAARDEAEARAEIERFQN